MAYRTPKSDSESPSPSPNSTDANVSPLTRNNSLSRAHPTADESEPSSSRNTSARGTPNRVSIDLPRTQNASKGGCWTCRLRRKKCDEQREGDSCRTCIRLTIECLGWGPKRPEWMRDKQAVEQYKANIKAQLTSKGLIRGQPRASLLQAQAAAAATTPNIQNRSHGRPPTYHRFSAPAESTQSAPTALGLDPDVSFPYRYVDPRQSLVPGVAGASNSGFHQLPGASYSDPSLTTTFDIGAPFFQYSPASSLSNEPLDFDFSTIEATTQNHGGFDFEIKPPSPVQHLSAVTGGHPSMQETHVMYYFDEVHKFFFLRGNDIINVTYSMIVQESQGALTNAVCALASLHYTRMRVAQGLEAPDPNPEHSTARYFHDEAYYQLANAKQLHGSHRESDILAALHLVCFSQMSGGATDWQTVFAIALDWLAHTGLPNDENPKVALGNMSLASQLIVKCIMWIDILSSLTLMKPPRFFLLYKRLLGGSNFWAGAAAGDVQPGLKMETLTGCSDDVLLAIAEVSHLAHWKANESRKGSLSVRELIRRGDEIEQRLQRIGSEPLPTQTDGLHVVGKIFKESVILYLHTVLSDASPAVPEINAAVNAIVQLLQQIPSSQHDRGLVFPICLAGCMTDDSTRRDLLKGRLQTQDESIGNLMRTRLLMEAVWQKRDVTGRAIDWREPLGERGLNPTVSVHRSP